MPKGIEAWVRVRRAAGTEKPDAEYLGRLLRVARGKDAETAEEQGDSENKSRCRHGLPSWLGSVTRQHTAMFIGGACGRARALGTLSLTGPGGREYTETTLRCL